MRFCRLLSAVILLVSSHMALALVSRTVEHSYPLTSGGRPALKLDAFYGNIQIESSETNEFSVKIREDFEALNDAEADRIAKRLILGLEFTGSTLSINAEYSRSIQWTFQNWPPVRLSFTISVPKVCDLDIQARDGSVTIGRMKGNAKVRTHYGQIFFRGMQGDIETSSDFGNIVISHCRGSLKLQAKSGSFLVGPVAGFADVSGYGGEIEVESGGAGIRAETAGAELTVKFRHPVVSPAYLKTGGASMILSFDARSTLDFDLRASIFGKVLNVKDALPLAAISGALGKSRVVAQMNGGGPRIDARANGGYIYLQATPEAERESP